MRIRKRDEDLSSNRRLPELLKGQVSNQNTNQFIELLSFTSRVGSTCDLGVQSVELTPGASSCCGSGCCCSSCCCW